MHTIVIGGGPGGSVAALALAQRGVRVTLLEAQKFPRPRPGESLPPAIEPLLAQLGLGRELAEAGFLRTAGVQVDWRGRSQRRTAGADARGPWRNYQADRARFDALLLAAAARAGVDVREECPVIGLWSREERVAGVRTARAEIQADYIVDASGGAHWLARRLGLEVERHGPQRLIRYGYGAPAPGRALPGEPELVSDAEGWTWLAPLGGERVAWVRLRWDGALEPAAWQPAAIVRAHGPSRGADVTWRRVTVPAGPGYFCVGDAAFVVDPLSSHGVLRAIMSGMQAAFLLGRVRDGTSPAAAAAEYNQWLRAWFEHETTNLSALYAQTEAAAA